MFSPPFQDSPFICEKSASICTEQCGDSGTLWAINDFQCIKKFLHVLSVRKRLNFFCFLPQPGILHVPNLGLDCLINRLLSWILGLVQSVFFFKKPLNLVIILIKPVKPVFYAFNVLLLPKDLTISFICYYCSWCCAV